MKIGMQTSVEIQGSELSCNCDSPTKVEKTNSGSRRRGSQSRSTTRTCPRSNLLRLPVGSDPNGTDAELKRLHRVMSITKAGTILNGHFIKEPFLRAKAFVIRMTRSFRHQNCALLSTTSNRTWSINPAIHFLP